MRKIRLLLNTVLPCMYIIKLFETHVAVTQSDSIK